MTLNGGAAAGILTFLGHSPELRNKAMAYAIFSFGVGALLAAFDFGSAYLAQLHYGNRELGGAGAQRSAKLAGCWHKVSYLLFILSAACFLIGLGYASCAILMH